MNRPREASAESLVAFNQVDLDVDQVQVMEKKEEKDVYKKREERPEDVIKTYLPWFIAAAIGFMLLIIAVGIMANAGTSLVFPYKPQYFNVPSYQGSMRVYSVDGQKLRYITNLRFIASQISRNLRYRVEPKLKSVYTAADLPVDSVVVIAFKYGGAGEMAMTQRGRSVMGRASSSKNVDNAIVIRHWVYLYDNVTSTAEEIKEKVLSVIDEVDGISVDKSSIAVDSLENMTRTEAIQALTQAGFFKYGLKGLDLQLLDVFGINFGLQSEDDKRGHCSALTSPMYGTVTPRECTTQINTFHGMTCTFECTSPYTDLSGSKKRSCMSNGLWSGQPTRCRKPCPAMTPLTTGTIKPQACTNVYSTMPVGQMCFLDCSVRTYSSMALPRDLSLLRNILWTDTWPSLQYESVHPVPPKLEDSTDLRSYFTECMPDGNWAGSGASCKEKCTKLYHPPHGTVSPPQCLVSSLEGDQCMVTCDPGYSVQTGRSFLLTCDISGEWTDNMPYCQKRCPFIQEIPNMSIQPAFCLSATYENLKCMHTCDVGYVLNGTEVRTCIDGSWDLPAPHCLRSCTDLPHPEHGMFVSDSGTCADGVMLQGVECTLYCDVGYVPSAQSVVCQEGGDWSSDNLQCIRVCQPVSVSGSWSPTSCQMNHHSELGACTLTCAVGYTLHGASSLTCSSDGVWSDEPGVCIANCPALTPPVGGFVENKELCTDGSATVGTSCKFSCNAGYGINGDKSVVCTNLGWSNTEPTCQVEVQVLIAQERMGSFVCLAVDDNGHAIKLYDENGSCEQENARWVTANTGQLISVASGNCLMRTESSTLLHMEYCVNNEDGQKFDSGYGLTLKILNSEIYVTSGYRTVAQPQLDSHPHSVTDTNLQWGFYYAKQGISGEPSSMYGILGNGRCSPLRIDPKISATPAQCLYNYQEENATCTLSCTTSLSDPLHNVTTCRKGYWDVDPHLFCISSTATPCNAYVLKDEWNVTINPSSCAINDTNPGGICTFSCFNPTEQHLVGPSSVFCSLNGRWSSQTPPICNQRCKNLFSLPESSYLITGDAKQCAGTGEHSIPGSVCQLACHNGLLLIGESLLTCLDNGEWNAPPPKCVSTCGDIYNIEHGSLVDCSMPKHAGRYLAGTTCNFACRDGYYLGLPEPTVSCQSYGAWLFYSHGEAKCLRNCIPFTNVSMHNTIVQPITCMVGTPTVGTSCTFTCEEGFGFEIRDLSAYEHLSYFRMCLESGTWSGEISVCTRRCEVLQTDALTIGYFTPSKCETTRMKPGAVCSFNCQDSREVSAVSTGANLLVCGVNGVWKKEADFGQCAKVCNALYKERYLIVSPYACTGPFVKAGTQCILSCPDHMERIGPGYRTCEVGEDLTQPPGWSGDDRPTHCVARCSPLNIELDSAARVFPEDCLVRYKIVGDKCAFTCPHGSTASGNPNLYCVSSGDWNAPVPFCNRHCPRIDIKWGTINCDSGVEFAEGVGVHGFYYRTGTKCSLVCEDGFTSLNVEEMSCDSDGVWKPVPRCIPASDAFPIVQKIGELSVCLQASSAGNDRALIPVHFTEKSTEGCDVQNGNGGMWLWYDKDHIQHAETGLCLTTESRFEDASLLLQICDLTNRLQRWICGSAFPYRISLKDTELGIGSRYPELGPVLQKSFDATTYWISYSPLLESPTTACAVKFLNGVCAPIKKTLMKISPGCDTFKVDIWTECSVTCTEGSILEGEYSKVVCSPTGEWRNLDKIICQKQCSRLSPRGNGTYNSTRCTDFTSGHQMVCKFSCFEGYILLSEERNSIATCLDGEWHGDTSSNCLKLCTPDYEIDRGKFTCSSATCRVKCDPGFVLANSMNDSEEFNCMGSQGFPRYTCVESTTFLLLLKTGVIYNSVPCITVIIANGKPKLVKMACGAPSTYQYWRWTESLLQNVGTDLCMRASANKDWAELELGECIDDDLGKLKCHPAPSGVFGLKFFPYSYVDAGSIKQIPPANLGEDVAQTILIDWIAPPPVLRVPQRPRTGYKRLDVHQLPSSDWAAVRYNNAISEKEFLCTLRTLTKSAYCPYLPQFSTMKYVPEKCGEKNFFYEKYLCDVSCDHPNLYEMVDARTRFKMVCQASGYWNDSVQLCVAKKNTSLPTCSPISLYWRSGLHITPPKCGDVNGDKLRHGTTCSFYCTTGFYLKGSENISCKDNETWTDDVPECIAYCPGLHLGDNVEVDNHLCEQMTVSRGTFCKKTCRKGFVPANGMGNKSETTCFSDGTWSEHLLKCEAGCPLLSSEPFYATSNIEDLQNHSLGRVLTNESCAYNLSRPGTTCNFYCGDGNVTVDGDSSVICGKTGKWMGKVPRCIPKYHCPPGVEDEHGKVAYKPLLNNKAVYTGTVLKLNCKEGSLPDGDELRVCRRDGHWGGNGPAIPRCRTGCRTLISPFASDVCPYNCKQGIVDEGTQCIVVCTNDLEIEPGIAAIKMTCSGGVWSVPVPRCFATRSKKVDKELEVYSRDGGFIIYVMDSKEGCLYADENNIVRWRPKTQCSLQRADNRWSWYDNKRITVFGKDLCMQPSRPSREETSLVVGSCNTTFALGCGNPKSIYLKNFLFSHGPPHWNLGYGVDATAGVIWGVQMRKIVLHDVVAMPDSFQGIGVYTNVGLYPGSDRQTVCASMCGGVIRYDGSDKIRTITSPGFLHGEYPPYSYCHWTFFSLQKILVLTLREIDVESSLDGKCSTDCIRVVEGNHGDEQSISNTLAFFSGNDVNKLKPRIVKSPAAMVQVYFSSDRAIQGRGFAMHYQFVDHSPSSEVTCGSPKLAHGASDTSTKGVPSNIQKWPWIVSIREIQYGTKKGHHRCTGALIAGNVVLSAAHCLRFTQQSRSRVDIAISNSLQNDMDNTMNDGTVNQMSPVFHVYHGYDYASRSGDLALWRLMKPVLDSSGASPICIPDGGFAIHQPLMTCVSAGWTSLSHGTTLNQLAEYKVKIVSTSWCKESLGLGSKATFACGKNINFDRSGKNEKTESEPLMCEYKSRWYLVGVGSYTHIGSTATYRLYTEIHKLADWIAYTVRTMNMYEKNSQGAHLLQAKRYTPSHRPNPSLYGR